MTVDISKRAALTVRRMLAHEHALLLHDRKAGLLGSRLREDVARELVAAGYIEVRFRPEAGFAAVRFLHLTSAGLELAERLGPATPPPNTMHRSSMYDISKFTEKQVAKFLVAGPKWFGRVKRIPSTGGPNDRQRI